MLITELSYCQGLYTFSSLHMSKSSQPYLSPNIFYLLVSCSPPYYYLIYVSCTRPSVTNCPWESSTSTPPYLNSIFHLFVALDHRSELSAFLSSTSFSFTWDFAAVRIECRTDAGEADEQRLILFPASRWRNLLECINEAYQWSSSNWEGISLCW